ncbi:acyl-CoA thioesterase [Ructibacterium gallinarum]|uniref:Acyl-CoA thioesterase n=1 Tax=Ructibacterium gallinarum TaxID=2779355 RepID=A0A9D5R8J8_9FIRM|nr:acyl-CoA thioesterase [Ructibacterium gallinarum]MBE5040060.1 acyl-CoA thioesterase [Ructibacterium gallinarum]
MKYDDNASLGVPAPENAKRTSDSYTEQIQILNQSSMNGYHRLFGGQLMEWIDVVAAIVARRHSGCNVTTAAIDNLQFLGPAYANDSILLTGKLTYVGHTSMEVCVKTYVEQLSGRRNLINTAYVLLVALDAEEKPAPVPGLILETLEERMEWEAGEKRRALRKQRRQERF